MAHAAVDQKTEGRMLSDRVKRERDALFSATPQIDTDRIRFLLDVYRETEMEPDIVRRAKLLDRLCSERGIYIDGNPIVGTLTKYKYGAPLYPEEAFKWIERVDEVALPRGKTPITQEVREWIDKALVHWRDKNSYNTTREIVKKKYGVDINTLAKCGVGLELTPGGGRMWVVPDYQKVLNKGFKGILEEVELEEAKLDIGGPDGLARWHFYQAAKLVLNAVITLANRYAELAREMAEEEGNQERRLELKGIADRCEWVPANPARNFHEAIQSFWFTMLGVWLEGPGGLNSPPVTLTRCLYPFYRREKDEGKLTDEEVIEQLHLLTIKFNQLAYILPPHGFAFNQSRLGMQLSLGGLTPSGEDATNELDWLVLEAQTRLKFPEPLVNIIYHNRLSEEFLLKCMDLIRTGIGQPALHNSQVIIDRHMRHNRMPLEEARTCGVAGCVQSHLAGNMDFYWYARFNVAKMIELALNNGKDALVGTQLGPETGSPEGFGTYGELYGAFLEQLEYFLPLIYNISRVAWNGTRRFPVPLGSTLVNDCIEKGMDMSDGGARYSFGDGVCLAGVIDAANSLAAVKKLVFEDKEVTMGRMIRALAADFEGYEDVERMCKGAPKYGNDIEYVDSIARDIYATCCDIHPELDHLGRPVLPSAYSVTAHFAFGRFTGALPNGKKARQHLVDGSISAQGGTDKNGPTALVNSAAKVIDSVKYSSDHFNMKFHPAVLEGPEGARKLLSLIKTYFDLGGYHVQFNCVSGETLKAAQLHPEDYQNLVVRVAGFSAYFAHLDKDVQDDVIKRTELRM